MSPFNLEKALKGAPVITRNGCKVSHLTEFTDTGVFKLFGIVDGYTEVDNWTLKGSYLGDGIQSRLDLFLEE